MNCLRASTVRPLLRTPLTVGNLGSSQPSTTPSSTNQVNFLLDITVFVRFNLKKKHADDFLSQICIPLILFPFAHGITDLAYAQMSGFLSPRASINQKNCSSLSMYSVVRREWVTPSTLSTIGHAKS